MPEWLVNARTITTFTNFLNDHVNCQDMEGHGPGTGKWGEYRQVINDQHGYGEMQGWYLCKLIHCSKMWTQKKKRGLKDKTNIYDLTDEGH